MRILIDECLNWRLSRELTGHYATSVPAMGWSGLENGNLLLEAEKQFDVLLTGDRNLHFQQHLKDFNISVIVLHGRSTQLKDTLQLMPKVLALLPTLKPGSVMEVHS